MEQYTDNQYDDDLTVETDQYDESYYTDADDIFDLSADEESTIGRLKSLILSIDWEITDEVLLQFNEELLDLRDIWAGEKINLVYIQALQKISKYIYLKKAESHPNAIKLLLTLYHNLEKIVSSPDLSEAEKNAILFEDVRRFEGLKKTIGGKVSKPSPSKTEEIKETTEVKLSQEEKVQTIYSPAKIEELTNLKAIVLGIDWEIRDQDLEELHYEVVRLEKLYSDSKSRLILLQGIGTLGNYIKLKKSDAHAEAFRVLQFFYGSLEKITATPMNRAQEKEILFPAVEMFNAFKTLLGSAISPEVTSPAPEEDEKFAREVSAPDRTSTIAPALSTIADDEPRGFQAEEETRGLGGDDVSRVDTHVDGFFSDSQWDEAAQQQVEALTEAVTPGETGINFDEMVSPVDIDKETALQGVNVEEDDEEDELVGGGHLKDAEITKVRDDGDFPGIEPVAELSDDIAPALADTEDSDITIDLQEDSLLREGDDVKLTSSTNENILESASSPGLLHDKAPDLKKSAGDGSDAGLLSAVDLDEEQVLVGVDVYSEADDDSEEVPLPVTEGDLAPALSGALEEDVTEEDELFLPGTGEPQAEEEILSRVDVFFKELEDPATEYQDLAKSDKSQEVIDQDPVVSAELSQVGRDEEHGVDETAPIVKEDLSAEVVSNGVTGDPEEEQLSFDDGTESPGFLSEDDVDLSKENENLELEESIEAFFTDTSEPDSFEDELEIKVDADAEEFQDELPGVLSDDDEIEIDVDPAAGDHSQLADEDHAVSTEQADEDKAETIEQKIVSRIPAFKLATPKVKSAGLVEEVDRQPVDNLDLGKGDGEEVSSAETLDLADQDAFPGVVEEIEEEVIFELADEEVKFESDDPLSTLQLYVDSLGPELDDNDFSGMNDAIHRLRQSFVDKAVEKTFVELFAAITQHIERHQSESSEREHSLLRSVYEALKSSDENDVEANQEQLFVETCKVLNWQQELLEKKLIISTSGEENDSDVLVEFDEGFMELEEQNRG